MKLIKFKQFARTSLEIQIKRLIKCFRHSEKDTKNSPIIIGIMQNQCKQLINELFKDRQTNNFKKYKIVYEEYKKYVQDYISKNKG